MWYFFLGAKMPFCKILHYLLIVKIFLLVPNPSALHVGYCRPSAKPIPFSSQSINQSISLSCHGCTKLQQGKYQDNIIVHLKMIYCTSSSISDGNPDGNQRKRWAERRFLCFFHLPPRSRPPSSALSVHGLPLLNPIHGLQRHQHFPARLHYLSLTPTSQPLKDTATSW